MSSIKPWRETMKKAIINYGSCVRFFVFILIANITCVQNVSQAEPRSYPLVCRGGGAMQGTLGKLGIDFTFKGGTQAATAKQPGPGECAWLDRGFRSGEPRKMSWSNRGLDRFFVDYGPSLKIKSISIQGRGSGNYKYLFESIRDGKLFYVHAQQKSCGGSKCPYLTITRTGP